MSKLEIGTITDYMKDWNDLQEEVPDFRTDDRFWHYVAGREYTEAPVLPIKPVKATWMILRGSGNMTPIAFNCIHWLLYPSGKESWRVKNED